MPNTSLTGCPSFQMVFCANVRPAKRYHHQLVDLSGMRLLQRRTLSAFYILSCFKDVFLLTPAMCLIAYDFLFIKQICFKGFVRTDLIVTRLSSSPLSVRKIILVK